MRFIPTRVHGVLDYSVGAVLAVSPWLLRFNRGGAETAVPVGLGAAALGYSIVTNYEWGLVKALPMPAHLALDAMSGVVMAASPWLFGFANRVWAPHLVFGLFELSAALLTETTPRHETGTVPGRPGAGV